ncbi:Acyl-CoA dehydrogenase [Caballeronia arvi]|uniref:Acyl-CoA dehydrogenase n=1 Tax=Caballeronia arvi TaxID=1777135 RepID=A0A158KHS7_9BURK|nr:acyl-CoA dehydrogenase family protein [Caballeronia arvi]SAL80120.1 Acyl-CoA dehydrogenase [Caballeronia arvi]
MTQNNPTFDAWLADVERFVRDEATPRENEVENMNEVPPDLVARMRELGYFGWSIPREFDGAGLTTEQLVRGAMMLSQASVAFRARVGTNTGIGSEALVADGTPDQKRRYLPRLASGELTGAFALTEPNAGSDATALATSARRDGDHYVLNGSKCFITNAPIADVFTVLARTDPSKPGAAGISAFIVERSMPGLSTSAPYDKMGQSGSPVGDVILRDCRVPAANLIGGVEGEGFRTAMKVLNKQRIHLAALCTGPAMRMLEEAVAYTMTREQFGKPIAEFQLIQALIAESQTDIFAARSMILTAARKRDAGEDVTMEASMCKMFASEMCGRVADRAVQMLGGLGYLSGNAVERFYRDVRAFRIYEGTTQIHQLNIAKITLKRAASQLEKRAGSEAACAA